MSDDLVRRLRGADAGFRIAVGTNEAFTFPTLHSEAADEIERLQADCDRWRKVADALAMFGNCPESCHGDDDCDCIYGFALENYNNASNEKGNEKKWNH